MLSLYLSYQRIREGDLASLATSKNIVLKAIVSEAFLAIASLVGWTVAHDSEVVEPVCAISASILTTSTVIDMLCAANLMCCAERAASLATRRLERNQQRARREGGDRDAAASEEMPLNPAQDAH